MPPSLKQLIRAWVLPFVDPRRIASLLRLPRFVSEFNAYRRLAGSEVARVRDLWPCLGDRSTHTPFDPHYFYQGAWLARRIELTRPTVHVDAGSSVLMVSVLSARVPTVFLDFRPLDSGLPGIIPVAADLQRLPLADASVQSLSCLHVVEHVGLGRYGDPLDPAGSVNALRELARVVRSDGKLFVSVPVGRERVCFNAHRVLAPRTVLAAVDPLTLRSFALVDDAGRFVENAAPEDAEALELGCGMFEFERPGTDSAH